MEMEILDIVQTIGIMATLLIAIWQIRITRKSLRSSTNNLISERVYEINKLLFDNPATLPGLEEAYAGDKISKEGDSRYHLVHIFLDLFTQIYAQRHHYDLIEQEKWKSWVRTMQGILNKPYVDGHWQKQKHQYDSDFVIFIEQLKSKDNSQKRNMD